VEADEEGRKAFLMAITGRNVLGKETKIHINWGWRPGDAVELHTCLNSIDLPNIDDLTREAFFEVVDAAILRSKKDYTIA